jgi:hypothetical protein
MLFCSAVRPAVVLGAAGGELSSGIGGRGRSIGSCTLLGLFAGRAGDELGEEGLVCRAFSEGINALGKEIDFFFSSNVSTFFWRFRSMVFFTRDFPRALTRLAPRETVDASSASASMRCFLTSFWRSIGSGEPRSSVGLLRFFEPATVMGESATGALATGHPGTSKSGMRLCLSTVSVPYKSWFNTPTTTRPSSTPRPSFPRFGPKRPRSQHLHVQNRGRICEGICLRLRFPPELHLSLALAIQERT